VLSDHRRCVCQHAQRSRRMARAKSTSPFCPSRREAIRVWSLSTTNRSGEALPETTDSPRPSWRRNTASSYAFEMGFRDKPTPATFASDLLLDHHGDPRLAGSNPCSRLSDGDARV